MDRVALELIKNLQVFDKENQYFIFVKPDEDHTAIEETENFKIVEIEGGLYPIWEQVKLPKVVKSYNCDVLHCTSNTAPLNAKIPLITTLHDVIFKEGSILSQLTTSASWYQKIGNLYRRLIVDAVVNKSHQIITVSNFEKQNISNVCGLDDSKIQTVHNGVNASFTTEISASKKDNVRKNTTFQISFCYT
ncbi:glycosyltransferase [Jejuia pallidilutea]|uniref:Glycosyltransferase n=2 Tax=Jejuia pallidilutea TaxID=504487 RepID=A0A090VRH1_9FLAO|nr:glycosyltransferase [Jejuia pallidilutea]